MNALEIKHLTKRYPAFTLDDVSLSVPRGYVTGFVGANGSGKTTTIKSALGLVIPDAGEISVAPRERIGVVLDTPPYYGEWRVADVTGSLARFYPTWDAAGCDADLADAGVSPTAKVKELSRGMGMRLQLAIALAHDPELLILDEPTAGLDPAARDDLRDRVASFITDERRAVLFSTHITTDLEHVADYLVVLSRGRVFTAGTLDEVKDAYRLVRGGPPALSGAARASSLGLRETAAGWQSVMPAADAEALVGVVVESPTLDELVAHVSKEDRHA